MSNAYLVVAIFPQADGTLSGPQIWHGLLGESPSEVKDAWTEHLTNYKGRMPVVSHIMEVDHNGHTRVIAWNDAPGQS